MEEQLPATPDPQSIQQETLHCLEQINHAALHQQALETVLAVFAAGIRRLAAFDSLGLVRFEPFPPGEQLLARFSGTGETQPGQAEVQVIRQPVSPSDRSLLALVQRTQQPLIIPDIHQHRFAVLPELVAQGIQAVMVLPLSPAGSLGPPGWVSFYSRQSSAYSRHTAGRLASPLEALAVAVQHANLTDQAAQAEAKLHDLSLRLLRAHEDERAILARELHDEVGQALTALKLNLRSVLEPAEQPHDPQPQSLADGTPVLRDSLRLTSELLEKVRGLSIDLHPPMLDDLGLAAALRWYARRASERGGLRLHLSVADDFPRLPRDVEVTFFRIGQEAITNVLRHAGAANVWLQLRQPADGLVELHVTDDGRGFALNEKGFQGYAEHSLGLRTMQERASLLGAHFEIETAPGQGTRLSVGWQGSTLERP